jgi:GGDEF domain-containing protein
LSRPAARGGASIGIAALEAGTAGTPGELLTALLTRADNALQHAKRDGRDRAVG